MINVNRPYHQWAIDDMQTLLATRYDAVVERLLYPVPGQEAFTTVIHDAANAAKFVGLRNMQYVIKECQEERVYFDLEKTLSTISTEEGEVRDASEITLRSDVVDLAVITNLNQEFDEADDTIGQLQWLICFGLIGAHNKPRVEDVQSVLRYDREEATPGQKAFRSAVKALVKRSLADGEEEAMARSLTKFERDLFSDDAREKERGRARITRYYRGRLARQILAALLNPHTTAQHVQDEIDILCDSIEPADAYMPKVDTLDGSVPTITLPWPILPPGDGPPQEVVIRAPRGEITNRRVYDNLRTRWLGSVAARWPYGGKFAKVELHNKSAEKVTPIRDPNKKRKIGDESRYRAAILKGPDGKVFAIIADSSIAFPENAMYAGIVKKLRDKEGRPVNWRRVFKGAKSEASDFGARQFLHAGHDVHARVLDYVCEAFEAQFGYWPDERFRPKLEDKEAS